MVLPGINATKSYWIEAAESDLRNFRSSDILPEKTDVVIVGSGYTGASTAYWLHKSTEQDGNTPKMLLLEAQDICGSASGRNGGQLRPHAYSRYPTWKQRFGSKGAMSLIKHEMAHLPAFKELLTSEGIAEEVCFKLGQTFDAAMSDEAWVRLKGAYDDMRDDFSDDDEIVRMCRVIEDAGAAEEFTQMKGTMGAVVHPSGQVWPYKFVHALLRIVLKTGNLNLQAHTPVEKISEKNDDGWITVETSRGSVQTRAVVHATNRWASHLLPDFSNLIHPCLATVSAIKGPEGLLKHTGAQHYDSVVNDYQVQLPPPYNTIMLGGAKKVLVHNPTRYINSNDISSQIHGVPEYFRSWPESTVASWPKDLPAELARKSDEGGCWVGVEATSIDSFPFVGAHPSRVGHFIAAGFTGHGMPRILLSTAYITPLILQSLDIAYSPPAYVATFPELPEPFRLTAERIESLQTVDAEARFAESVEMGLLSARKSFCVKGGRFARL